MRKIFMMGASAAASVLLMTGCNKQVIDLTYRETMNRFYEGGRHGG